MRHLAALALVLVACGRADRTDVPTTHDAPSASARRGPDPLVLRLPRAGGIARVFAYPKLDSAVWTSSDPTPTVERILGFDGDAGTVAFQDSKGRPGRIDFRLGSVAIASRAKLSALTTAEGSSIYGISGDGALVRLTPSGDWSFKPPRPARAAFPQHDGSLIVLAARGQGSEAWRIHPPETRLLDTVMLPAVSRVMRTQLGDRLYLVSAQGLIVLRTRMLDERPTIPFDKPVIALLATPSGDRLFVANADTRALNVVDRYQERVTSQIALPGQPEDLRIDPVGRYLLVRMARKDSSWVVAIGTDRLIGAVRSQWRADLPFVAPDGSLGLGQGNDVVFTDAETLLPRTRVNNGAQDFWFSFQWTGFRPRAATLDEPVQFATRDSTDTTAKLVGTPPESSSLGKSPAIGRDSSAARPGGSGPGVGTFTVSFAALLSEPRARELASQIHVRGQTARVVTSIRDGTTIYRIVLGPFPTREEAERIGHESRQSYWVYEGIP